MARQIIDDVVKCNRNRNLKGFYDLSEMPVYNCEVRDSSKDVIKLDTVSSKDASKLGLMETVIAGVENFTLEPGEATVVLMQNGITDNVSVNPIVIKLIKVATAASFSQNEDYCYVLSEMVKQLLENIKSITLPLPLPKNNKSQEVMSAELNNAIKELFEKHGVIYSAVLEQGKELNTLLKAANAAHKEE